ncbi:MAG: hypothetical protein U5J98_00555 [Halobacteriales archaeon]|nr:hypothetical protein [Halobacteriales archaeon]
MAINSERLAEEIDAVNGTATDGFVEAIEGNATFRLTQTNPTPERAPKVARVGPANLTVHRAGTTTYVVVDTGKLAFHYQGSEDHSAYVRDGNRFAVTFGYGLEPDAEASGPTLALHPTAAEFYRLEPGEPLPAGGASSFPCKVNIQPDTTPTVRLTLRDNWTVTHAVGPVDWSGFQGVTLDLRDVEPGTSYTLELVHDGVVVDRTNGTVLDPSARVRNATLTEVRSEQVVTRDGERVTEVVDDRVAVNVTVRLSHGGKVEVLDETCEQVGVEWVDPGVETRVSVGALEGQRPSPRPGPGCLRRRGPGPARGPDVRGDPLSGRGGPSDAQLERNELSAGRRHPDGADDGDGHAGRPVDDRRRPRPSRARTRAGRAQAPPSTTTDRTTTPGQPGFTAAAALAGILALALARRS